MSENFSLDKFDVIIQAGQSNSEGCGQGDSSLAFTPSPDILYMNNDFTITEAREGGSEDYPIGNFALSFAGAYKANGFLEPGRKILILRTAIGGTGFRDNHWGMKDDLYLKMMQMTKLALELNDQNRLIAFLWHQGETDAIMGAGKQEYYNNLSGLVNSVRDTYNYKSLPFVAGDFVNHWKNDNIEICTPVIDGMKEVCADLGFGRFVETDGLKSNEQQIGNGDTIHFSREALDLLGLRYFDAYNNIRQENK